MVNPSRKSLVTGISKPNRIGLAAHIGIDPDQEDRRIPIGPGDVISMHRHGAEITQAPLVIDKQPIVDRLDVFIGRLIKVFVRQVCRQIKQCTAHFFAHAYIVLKGQGSGYSQFPIVDFVHVATLGQGDAIKNVRGHYA